jgi:hypothetical protein
MALSQKQLKEAVALLKEQAKLQQEFSNDFDAYLGGLKKANAYKKELNRLAEIEKKLVNEVSQAANGSQAQQDAQDKLNLLRDQTKELQKQADILDSALKDANKSKMLLAKGGNMAFKSLGKIPGLFKSIYGEIKGLGLFEMDKAVKKTALSMGVLSKENISFTDNLRNASLYTNNMGVSLEELAKMQADYSNEIGRSVVLSEAGLKAMSEMAAATGLSAEEVSKLSSDMDAIGYSAERTRDFMAKTMSNSSKIGLNASKVVKNIQQNMKLLNKFNFKNGARGLAKMAETTTKLGVDMNFAASMAEKLFDIEGAVDMSAQLQVMGGEWAKLADPFKLMYMARNDMGALTEALGEAAKSAVHFNEKTGEFAISGLEMHRLRKIAEQTGVAYEDLAEAGRNAAKLSKIKSQVNFSVTGDKELAEYMTNKATFKDGKAEIMVNGKPKLLKMLDAADKKLLKDQIKEEQNLAERAKQAQTFDDSLTNLINMFKVTMLPIVDGINDVLKPLVQDLFNNKDFQEKLKQLGKDIAGFVKGGAEFVKGVVKWSEKYLGPKGVLMAVLGYKGLGFLLEKKNWFDNGIALSQGFLAGQGKGGFMDMLPGGKGMRVGAKAVSNGKVLKGLGIMTKSLGKVAAPLAAIGVGIDAYSNSQDDSLTSGDAVKKTIDQNKFMAMGAAIGGIAGAGVFSLPGMAIGAGIGGLADMMLGDDALVGDYPTNKKANDAILSGGKITPIDKKDDLLAMKEGGAIDKFVNTNNKQPQIMKHEFGDINISGVIDISMPGGENIPIDFTKNPIFMQKLTSMIHSTTEKSIKGGKI